MSLAPAPKHTWLNISRIRDRTLLPQAYGDGNFMLLWKKGADGNCKLSYAQLEDLSVQVKN